MTNITESHSSDWHNRFQMQRLRQFAAAFLIVAVLCLISAPLMACQAAGHRCAMMSHVSKPVAPTPSAKHDCCPKDKGTPVPAKPSCHEHAVLMTAECGTSTNCCEMGNTPVVSVVQAEPAKKSTLAIVSAPLAEPIQLANAEVERQSAIPLHPRPVLDLKADFRI